MIVLPVPSLHSPPVLAELQQAHLITYEECDYVEDIDDVVALQREKPSEVQVKTAEVFFKLGLQTEEMKEFAGKWIHSISPSALCVLLHEQHSPVVTAISPGITPHLSCRAFVCPQSTLSHGSLNPES